MKIGKLTSQSVANIKYNTWVKVYETTLTEAATTLTISGLTGDTDKEYKLEARIINGYAGEIICYIRPNNDTDANYGRQYLLAYSTTVAGNRDVINGIRMGGAESGQECLSSTILYVKSGYVRTSIINEAYKIATTSVGNLLLIGHTWNNTVNEITSLVILADQVNGLGIGSNIVLWKRSYK